MCLWGCFCMRFTFNSVDFEKSRLSSIVWVGRTPSSGVARTKDSTLTRKREFSNLLDFGLGWNIISFMCLLSDGLWTWTTTSALPRVSCLMTHSVDSGQIQNLAPLLNEPAPLLNELAQMVKNLPAMRETWVLSLCWEDPLEKGKATHFSILA